MILPVSVQDGFMNLSLLKPGRTGIITKVGGEKALRRHLLDMGLTPRTSVFVRKVAPLGDPIELSLRGYELTIRLADAEQIEVEECSPSLSVCTDCHSCSGCVSRQKQMTMQSGVEL